MKKQFETFNSTIRLTDIQEADAKIKYDGVCKTLHTHYFKNNYDGNSKFLFGSYKKKTNIRPITAQQDVDVIFMMPDSEFEKYDNYESNGQSALLQKVRDVLNTTYSTTNTIKGWGKVVLVKFSENKHNVEVLPAWKNADGSFKIPNSEDGGSWENFDPREDIKLFRNSNSLTNGQTAKMARMMKSWKRNTSSLKMKSFEIENYVIDFLRDKYDESLSDMKFSKLFFEYILNKVIGDNKTHVETAISRSEKAINFDVKGKYYKSSEQWRKIFGDKFPKWKKSVRVNSLDEDYSSNEEYIEDLFTQDLNNKFKLKIGCNVIQDGFKQKTPLMELLKKSILKSQKKLEFYIQNNTVPKPYSVYWKVRNFGIEAKDDLRGEITIDKGLNNKIENTKYRGEHYVECYIIKDNKCVSRERIDIPVKKDE